MKYTSNKNPSMLAILVTDICGAFKYVYIMFLDPKCFEK